MFKITFLIMSLFVFGYIFSVASSIFPACQTPTNLSLTLDESNLLLELNPKKNHIYLLKFVNGDSRWEGIGFRDDNNIIAIFRYKNVDEQGFVTFTLESNNKMSYISRNSDGSIRVKGYYIKE